jgi:hypothetical protein
MADKNMHLFVGQDGRFDAQLAKPNLDNHTQLDGNKVQKIAENLLSDQAISQGIKLEFDNIRYENACSGSTLGSGEIGTPYITGTTLEFRQVISGFKTINGDAGVVRVSVDNDGKITHIHNSTKEVVGLSSRSKSSPNTAPKDPNGVETRGDLGVDIEAEFLKQLAKITQTNSNGNGTRSLETPPTVSSIKQSEVGYDVSNNYGKLVARRTYELDMGNNFKKMYKVQVPLFE